MINFIKNNLLSLTFVVLAVSAISFADVITRPYSLPDYAGGTKAVGTKVNAEFQNIVDWLNGANIDNTNLAFKGIVGSNIADLTITNDKLAPLFITGASQSTFAVTGVTVAAASGITTDYESVSGRPVLVGLSGGSAIISSDTETPVIGIVVITRDNTIVYQGTFGTVLQTAQTGYKHYIPASAIRFIDTGLTAGVEYTYEVKVTITNASVTMTFESMNIQVVEL